MDEKNLEELLQYGKFAEVLDCIAKGEKLPKTLNEYNKSQILDNLFREKQFEIISLFAENGVIETDIYELDSFNKSVFESLTRYLSDDNDSIDFFRNFISKFDNLNDEVEVKTLLGFFFEKAANIESIKILIEAGCDVNFKNNAEENFIHQIVKSNLHRHNLSYEGQEELTKSYIELLIHEGLDVDAQNIVQKTPLICAVEFNHKHFLALLLKNGANPNHTDNSGNSAFFYAISAQFNLEMYEIMREFDKPHFDVLNKNQASILFEYVRMMSSSETGLQFLQKLIEDGADVYQTSFYYGEETTPLNLIAEKQTDILQTVLETGTIQINRQDNQGNTLLHKVCAYNVNYEAEKARETYRKVKLLIENGADVSLTNDQDQTALMLASDDNLKIKTIELLMKQS